MDILDNKSTVQPAVNDMGTQYEALRHMIISVMVLVLVISGTLNIYLLRQYRSTSKDLAGIRPQATQMMAEYQKQSGPFQDFVKKVTEYGRTNPEFAPVLVKYGLKAATLSNAPPPTPAPAAPKK